MDSNNDCTNDSPSFTLTTTDLKRVLLLCIVIVYCYRVVFTIQGRRSLRPYSSQTIKKSVDMKQRLEAAILGTGNARTEMMKRKQSQGILTGEEICE